jgi:programmed cell death protein 5
LSKEAIERLGRIRIVKPELASQLELYLLQLYQSGKIKKEITDEQLKMFLDSIVNKREFKIIK